jgi:hypothetical protein
LLALGAINAFAAAEAANLHPSGSDGSTDSTDLAEVSALKETMLRLQQARYEAALLDRDAARAHELQLI